LPVFGIFSIFGGKNIIGSVRWWLETGISVGRRE